jgi:PKD repeat protein
LNVSFTDLSTNSPTLWSWNFGDGGTSTQQNPSHTYTSAGTYTVTLTATNSCGSDDEVKVDYIMVTCVAPTAAFVGSPTSGEVPLNVTFTDQSTGSPTSWSWTFGDGGTSTQQNPSHTYTTAGTYTVTLTATNSCGSDDETKVDYITVNEPSGGWVTITYDDFEGGFGNYTDGGGDCYLYTGGTRAHQGRNAGAIQDNSGTSSSFYHTAGHNVSAYADLEVEFWYYAWSMDNSNEDFWVQYYDGSTWRTVETFARGIDFENGIFYHEVVSIPRGTYNYPSNAKLRFRCDASGNADDVYIDEIEFRGFSSGGPLPPTAAFVGNPTSGNVPLDVSFTDQSTGDPTGWS